LNNPLSFIFIFLIFNLKKMILVSKSALSCLPFTLAYWTIYQDHWNAFSALTLLVWRQEGHPACINWVMCCCRGCLSGARCKWSAYGPADATAFLSSLAAVKSRMAYFSGDDIAMLSWKKAVKWIWLSRQLNMNLNVGFLPKT